MLHLLLSADTAVLVLANGTKELDERQLAFRVVHWLRAVARLLLFALSLSQHLRFLAVNVVIEPGDKTLLKGRLMNEFTQLLRRRSVLQPHEAVEVESSPGL